MSKRVSLIGHGLHLRHRRALWQSCGPPVFLPARHGCEARTVGQHVRASRHARDRSDADVERRRELEERRYATPVCRRQARVSDVEGDVHSQPASLDGLQRFWISAGDVFNVLFDL